MKFRYIFSLAIGVASCSASRQSALVTEPVNDKARQGQVEQNVKEQMWRFAFAVRDLNDALGPYPENHPNQKAVIESLDTIDEVARLLLSRPDTRHQLIVDNMPRFLKMVTEAKEKASAAKPNFVPAAGLMGACVVCHDVNTCPHDAYEKCVDVPIY